MLSSYDKTKQLSQYHFDTSIMDPRWDTVIGLGRFSGEWQQEVQEAIKMARPASWETRGYKSPENSVPSQDLQEEEYDLTRAGMDAKMTLTHLTWDLAPVFQKMSDLFAMEDPMARLHVQKPGEVWNVHIDKLNKWCPQDPDRVLRLFIQLTDWQPGQFWEFGNYHWNRWRAGDIIVFDWQNLPHSTANAGYHPRVTLQLTGIKTDATEKFINLLKKTSVWKV